MLVLAFPVFCVLCAAVISRRRTPDRARHLFALSIVAAATPFVLHAWSLFGSISGYGDPQPPIGGYPGLVAFLTSAIVFAIVTTGAAIACATVSPLAASLAPLALGAVYWLVSLRLLRWRAPSFVPVDGTPLIWLFAWGVFSAFALMVTAWVTFRAGVPTSPARL